MCDGHGRTRLWQLLAVVLLVQHVATAAGVLSAQPSDFDFAFDGAVSLAKRDIAAAAIVTGARQSDENANIDDDDNDDDDEFAAQRRRSAASRSDMDGVDFVAYENDFNMQDVASIPEDILDQQHIQDGDIIAAADMLYGESEAADIVLESQRSTSNNCTSYDSGGCGSGSGTGNNKSHVKSNATRTNNKDHRTSKDIDENRSVGVDGGIGSAPEHMPSWLERWPGDELAERRVVVAQQAQQKIDEAVGILNKRKFNKVPSIEKRQRQRHGSGAAVKVVAASAAVDDGISATNAIGPKDGADETAIGDIEESFRNEDEAWQDDSDQERRPSRDELTPKGDTKSDSSALGLGLSTSNGIVVIEDVGNVRRQHEREREQDTAAAIDTDESVATAAEAKVVDAAAAAKSTASAAEFPFVGRKAKRHGAPTYSRVWAPRPDRREAISARVVAIASDDDDDEDGNEDDADGDGDEWRNDAAAPKMHDDYSISYFGQPVTSATAKSPAWPRTEDDDADDDDDGDGDGEGDVSIGVARHYAGEDVAADMAKTQHATAATTPATTSTTTTMATTRSAAGPLSAFELHKAERRNNRRYGHRTHKKKYKDYLRYVMAAISATTTTTATAAAATTTATAAPKTMTMAPTTATVARHAGGSYMEEGGELLAERRAAQQRKYAKKMAAEQSRGAPASPIFVVGGAGSGGRAETPDAAVGSRGGVVAGVEHTTKPFYEGQINYYARTRDEDVTVGRMRQRPEPPRSDATSSDWYRRVSPVLRSGLKPPNPTPGDLHRSLHRQYAAAAEHHIHPPQQQQQQAQHHYRNHAHKHHYHHLAHHHRQRQPHHHVHHPPAASAHGAITTTSSSSSTTAATPPQPAAPPFNGRSPHAGAMQELGHQITEMDDFERYYAKWPHLARVKFQVYDEHQRETHPEIYADYDYESAAELEEALNGDAADADLPPYIKKYNRRNKQLLNLLEGTLPPPTRPPPPPWRTWSTSLLQPGPHDSAARAATVVRLDDDYLKAKRQRYHAHHRNDPFAQQRHSEPAPTERAVAAEQAPSSPPPPPPGLLAANQLPDEDVSVSREEQTQDEREQEIETKSNVGEMTGSEQMAWKIEKLTTPPSLSASVSAASPATSSSPKAAVFRLPSYPALASSYMAVPRSRSAQFAPSTGLATGRRAANMFGTPLGHKTMPRFSALDGGGGKSSSSLASVVVTVGSAAHGDTDADAGGTTIGPPPAKTINTFVYHRVVDASPRLVGAGSTGRKQRLPFVAITDRRLETSKKAAPPSLERLQDFEQNNHFPMP